MACASLLQVRTDLWVALWHCGIVAFWHCGIAVMDLLFQELTLSIIVTDTKKVCMYALFHYCTDNGPEILLLTRAHCFIMFNGIKYHFYICREI